ncbi:MAG: hypothetical protein JW981_10050 [Anaerolineae bacterium]|nr:hypothetical protein [Anaerolineae bacterium]
MDRRPGCIGGLFRLAVLNAVYDWFQEQFGFGRGASCTGMGCGLILLIIFLLMACSIVTGTDWLRLF